MVPVRREVTTLNSACRRAFYHSRCDRVRVIPTLPANIVLVKLERIETNSCWSARRVRAFASCSKRTSTPTASGAETRQKLSGIETFASQYFSRTII